MKYMSECYAMYLNHKYSYRGHVFESRYKSCLVKEDAYFLQTSRYIHLNPVKAQMTNYPEDYPWSSYQTMIATVYKGNIIKNLIMDCQSYTKYRPNETTGGIFVSWRRKEELPTGA